MKIGPITIGRDPLMEAARTIVELEAEKGRGDESLSLLQERIAELEFSLEDINWSRLGLEGATEFSRNGLAKITNLARLTYLKNPLISRAVAVQAQYIWGQGVNIQARSEAVNDVVQAFWEDRHNRAELTSMRQLRQKEVDLQVEGNLFFVFFTNPSSGRVKLRTIPFDQVQDVVCNPEDRREPWFYKRVWNEVTLDRDSDNVQHNARTDYYPDWRYQPADKYPKIGGYDVHWDQPVYHVHTGGLGNMRFGLSEVYAALDWARAYKEQLEDDATRSRALARFAWNLTTKGGARGVAAAKAKLGTTFGNSPLSVETNPPPLAGSTFLSSENVDLKATDISRATLPVDHAHPSKLMAIAALGLPETFFGDVAKGNHATAKTLDRPTELKMRERQQLWQEVFQDIFEYVIQQALMAPNNDLGGIQTTDDDGEVFWVPTATAPDTNEIISVTVDVSFPSILEHDVDVLVTAIVNATTLAGNPAAGTLPAKFVTQQLLQTLQADDIDELLATMYNEDGTLIAPTAPPSTDPATAGVAAEALQTMAEAARELKAALTKTKRKAAV